MKTVLRISGGLLVLAALAASALLFVLVLNLRTYARLTYEQPVAGITFEEHGPQRFVAIVTRMPSLETQRFELAGDEWQVDAKVLKWTGVATVLGLDARYRLERISGRYRDVEQERTAPRSVYSLAETPAIDLWAIAKAHPSWFWFLDGLYGSATYLPMVHGATYEVTLTQSGLIARATNPVARAAMFNWR